MRCYHGKQFVVRRVADVALSQEINLLGEEVRLGLSQKKTPRDSTKRTARGVLLMRWAENGPLSQQIIYSK